jgi:hypothetical protein
MLLLEFVGLGPDVFRDRFRNQFLILRLAIVRERKIHPERKRLRLAGQPAKDRFGFLELLRSQPRGRYADASVSLELLDFEDLPLGFRIGARREVFPNTFSVRPTGNPINDLPGGIREL